jgi:hypothetical protein
MKFLTKFCKTLFKLKKLLVIINSCFIAHLNCYFNFNSINIMIMYNVVIIILINNSHRQVLDSSSILNYNLIIIN